MHLLEATQGPCSAAQNARAFSRARRHDSRTQNRFLAHAGAAGNLREKWMTVTPGNARRRTLVTWWSSRARASRAASVHPAVPAVFSAGFASFSCEDALLSWLAPSAVKGAPQPQLRRRTFGYHGEDYDEFATHSVLPHQIEGPVGGLLRMRMWALHEKHFRKRVQLKSARADLRLQ